MRTRIIGTGCYLPETVLTNHDFETWLDTSDEWIQQRTGIKERHWVKSGEGPADLGIKAARQAMDNAGVGPEEIDYVLLATASPDYLFPASACLIQCELGIERAPAMDISAACSGFIYGIEIADAFIRSGIHKTVLFIGAEAISKRIDPNDRNTAVILGDGAGAVVLRGEEGEHGILTTYTGADGRDFDVMNIPGGGVRFPNVKGADHGYLPYVQMNGRQLFKRAVTEFAFSIEKAMKDTDLGLDDIKVFIPHQANIRIIQAALERVGLPVEKAVINLDRVGNTSAASIPIALHEACEAGTIQSGDLILLAAFGAGVTWGSAVVRW